MSKASGNICIEVSRFHSISLAIFAGSIVLAASWLDKRIEAASPGAFMVSKTTSTDSSSDPAITAIHSGLLAYAVSMFFATIRFVFIMHSRWEKVSGF